MIQFLAAASQVVIRVVKVGASDSTVALTAVIVGGLVGVLGPIVAGIFLWKSTGRTIDAEKDKQTQAFDEERKRLAETLAAEDQRQANALAEERARLDATLGAEDRRLDLRLLQERNRLATQLDHDRRQTDLADLRGVLEDVLTAASRAHNSVRKLWSGAIHSRDQQEALIDMEAQLDRLRIRLGRNDHIFMSFQRMGDATHALMRRSPPTRPLAPKEMLAVPEIQIWAEAYHEFCDLVQERAGSRDQS